MVPSSLLTVILKLCSICFVFSLLILKPLEPFDSKVSNFLVWSYPFPCWLINSYYAIKRLEHHEISFLINTVSPFTTNAKNKGLNYPWSKPIVFGTGFVSPSFVNLVAGVFYIFLIMSKYLWDLSFSLQDTPHYLP